MGCRSSCYIAQRITNAIQYILGEIGVEIVNYLDDLGGAEIPECAKESFCKMGMLLADLKILESEQKACGPNTRMLFLGILIDTVKMTMELDDIRMKDIRNVLAKWENWDVVSLKDVQRLVGVLSFASTCIRQGRPFFARILNFLRDMPKNGVTKVPLEVLKDINWWKKIAPLYNGVSCIPVKFWSKPDSWFSTDACLSGGGGFFDGEFFHFDFSEELISKGKHINQFELFVLWKAVELWCDKICRRNILIYCDNKTTVDGLKSGISKNRFSQACLRNILHFAAVRDFQIRAVHIEGVNNWISDCLSRWNLHEKYRKEFHSLTKDINTKERQIINTEFIDLY